MTSQRETDAPGACDAAEFDAVVSTALAISVSGAAPSPETRVRLMDRVEADLASGFAFALGADDTWQPHAVPGIRMKILALNRRRGYVTLLLDVAPGTRFPPHHHGGAEECYVVSGSLFTCGRRLEAGDFVHADPGTDHGELWTDEGCRVILVVPPEEHLSESQFRQSSPYGRAP
ncbi:MAG TPA: cupin domain-containing protein [Vicinamibacterales bacterium]|jgi:anti-sigma factor ChrR (cupin superfamily)|nr:cupin domain-containing protein [Vicinamibacterales bacterium]